MGWIDLLERLKRAGGLTDRQVASIERRRAFRIPRRVGILGIRANGQKIPMLGINFGAKGIRAEAPQRLRRDEILKVVTTSRSEQHRTNIDVEDDAPHVRVVWSRRHKDVATHDVGLVFVLDTPHLRRAAAHFLIEDCRIGIRNPKENRKQPRVPAEMRAFVTTEDCNIFEVIVKDIAAGGALLSSPRTIERGTALDLKIFLPGVAQALVGRGTVVRCQKVGRGHELGVAFTSVADDHKERLVAHLSRLMRSPRP